MAPKKDGFPIGISFSRGPLFSGDMLVSGRVDGLWSGFKHVYVQYLLVAVVSCPFSRTHNARLGGDISHPSTPTFLKFDDTDNNNYHSVAESKGRYTPENQHVYPK